LRLSNRTVNTFCILTEKLPTTIFFHPPQQILTTRSCSIPSFVIPWTAILPQPFQHFKISANEPASRQTLASHQHPFFFSQRKTSMLPLATALLRQSMSYHGHPCFLNHFKHLQFHFNSPLAQTLIPSAPSFSCPLQHLENVLRKLPHLLLVSPRNIHSPLLPISTPQGDYTCCNSGYGFPIPWTTCLSTTSTGATVHIVQPLHM